MVVYRKSVEVVPMERSLVEEVRHQLWVEAVQVTCLAVRWGAPLAEGFLLAVVDVQMAMEREAELHSEVCLFLRMAWRSHQERHSSWSCS